MRGYWRIKAWLDTEGKADLVGKLRDEFLNMNWFLSLGDLQEKAQDWRDEYYNERPHSSLKMKTPKEFLESYDKGIYAV